MTTQCSFHIDMHNDPSILGRVLLAFSRRRLRISDMEFRDDGGRGRLRIGTECCADAATDVAKQLRRVVEIAEVSLAMSEQPAVAPRLDRSAA